MCVCVYTYIHIYIYCPTCFNSEYVYYQTCLTSGHVFNLTCLIQETYIGLGRLEGVYSMVLLTSQDMFHLTPLSFNSCLMRYGGRYLQQSCMSVRINSRGTHLIALRRRLPPVLYELSNTNPLCDLDHDGYYNSCTMKSCSFAGPNDEVSLSILYLCISDCGLNMSYMMGHELSCIFKIRKIIIKNRTPSDCQMSQLSSSCDKISNIYPHSLMKLWIDLNVGVLVSLL